MFTNPSAPNLTDFTAFVYSQGVLQTSLPSNSDYLVWALGYGENIALTPPADMPPILYVMAVYNLGMHFLIKVAQDVQPSNFFQTQRTAFGMLSFVAGPVISSGDAGTNQTLLSADWMKGMTITALDYLKTPWGREYLGYAQAYGSNICGVS